jgi:hypothetical protein
MVWPAPPPRDSGGGSIEKRPITLHRREAFLGGMATGDRV